MNKLRIILGLSSILIMALQSNFILSPKTFNVSEANNSIPTVISSPSKKLLSGAKKQSNEEKEKWEEQEEKRINEIIYQNFKDRSIPVDYSTNKLTYDNYIYPLAKIIFAEAGNMNDTHQQYVGYVVMNRVDSKYFPNTIHDVFFSGGYAETSKQRYRAEKVTTQAIKNATVVINNYFNGTVPVSKAMVYQAEFKQGVNNLKMGNTYFAFDKRIINDLKKEKENK